MLAGSLRNRSLWTPERINTALWLDAADSSTVAVVDGGVSEWRDKSGNSRHSTQSTPASRPTFNPIGLNSKPSIRFQDTFLTLPFIDFGSAISAYVVLKTDLDPPIESNKTGLWSFGSDFATSDTPNSHYPWVDGVIYEGFGTTTRKMTVNPSISLTSPHIYNVQSEINNYRTRLNDSEIFSTNTNKVGNSVYNLGKGINDYFLWGDISELIFVLNGDNRSPIVGYLAHKWGLSANLPADHPYKNYPPRGL